jgi:hypothetical protein
VRISDIFEPRRNTKADLQERKKVLTILNRKKDRLSEVQSFFRNKCTRFEYMKRMEQNKLFNRQYNMMKEQYLGLKKASDEFYKKNQGKDDFFE